MSKKYFLSPSAIKHLREHKKWSLKNFGNEMTRKYFQDIDKGLDYIAENYNSFPQRPELTGTTGLSLYPVREHHIIFIAINDVVYVVDILGQAQDIPSILNENAKIFKRELVELKRTGTTKRL